MVEHGLREGLARRSSTKLAVEAERLHDGQVGLDGEHGSSRALLLAEDLTTALVKDRVDTANSILGTLDLDKVDGLLETRGGKQACGVTYTTTSGDDLTSTAVDSVSVELKKG